MIAPHRTPVLVLTGWVAFIFGTSCTVIRPQEFFDFLHREVFTDPQTFEEFQTFWGVSWFAIVKGWHAAEFAILTWLCARVICWKTGAVSRKSIIASMLCCTLFAASDEWHQSFVPDRLGTVTDVLIDSLGILAAGLVLSRQTSPHSRRTNATHAECGRT